MSEKTTGKKKNKRRSIARKMWTAFAIFVGLVALMFVVGDCLFGATYSLIG